MTERDRLAQLVAGAPGSLVLPVRPRSAPVEVHGPLALVDAYDLDDGRWVGVVADADAGRWTVPLLLHADGVRRAAPGDGVAEALVRALGRDDDTAFVAERWHREDVTGERPITADQTNESVVVGERAVVKWCVRLPGPGVTGAQPAGDRLTSLLAERFTATPRPWGLLTWVDHRHGTDVLLATVAQFLPGAQDGWDWAVDDVRRYALGDADLATALAPPRILGTLTADLHAALSSDGVRHADAAVVRTWRDRAVADLAGAVRLVGGEEGERLRILAPRVAEAFDVLATATGSPMIHVHGDLHVGQVLRHGEPPEYAITDFDGNPVLAAHERSAAQPAAVDVAGMLASLDHVGRVVVKRTDGVDVARVTTWIDAAQDAYLAAYRDGLGRHGASRLLDERLLVPLRLHQEIREYLYAVHHLPHWVYVPDAALPALLGVH